MKENKVIYKKALYAVIKDGMALKDIPKCFRSDYKIVLTAVGRDGLALKYASLELQNNFIIVLTAVKQHGWALYYASPELQNNFIIVFHAVSNSGRSLIYASDRLCDDEIIALQAVRQDGGSLEHVSDRLANFEPNIVLQSIRSSLRFIVLMSDLEDFGEYFYNNPEANFENASDFLISKYYADDYEGEVMYTSNAYRQLPDSVINQLEYVYGLLSLYSYSIRVDMGMIGRVLRSMLLKEYRKKFKNDKKNYLQT